MLKARMLAAAMLICVAVDAAPAKLPKRTLHSIRDIYEISNEEALSAYPVRLEAVVLYSDAPWGLLFVRDRTDSLYIDTHGLGVSLAAGTRVRITGVVGPGETSPVIVKPNVKPVGRGTMPAPEPFTLDELQSGKGDGAYVFTRGILRAGRPDWDRISYRIFDGDTSAMVVVPRNKSARADALVGAVVNLRGVGGVQLGPSSERIGSQLYVNSLDDITVEEPPAPDPIASPPAPIGSIGARFAGQRFRGVTHIRGTVTWARSGLFCIEDSSGTICVEASGNASVQAGNLVEVTGYPTRGQYGLCIADPQVYVISTAPRPFTGVTPLSAAIADNFPGSKPVTIGGRLIEQHATSKEHVFILESGRIRFRATLSRTGPDSEMIRLPIGSILEVTGLVLNERTVSASPGFALKVLSQSDIVTLRAGRWLTFRKVLTILGCLSFAVIAAMLWVTQLRRTVQHQTHTIRIRLENELQLEKEYRRLFEHNLAAVFRWKPEGTIVSCNEAFARMLGYANTKQVVGKSYWRLNTNPGEKEEVQALLAGDGISNRSAALTRADGGLLRLLENITPVANPDGIIYETTALDVTQLRRNEADLQLARDNAMKLALNDALTGLPNRRQFAGQLESALLQGRERDVPVCLLYLDLDGFKLVNDSFGHATGDALLVEVANRINIVLAESGSAARLGGDEFTILISDPVPREKARIVATDLLAVLAQPFRIGEHDIIIGGSIGISISPEDSACPETLLQQADSAMYAAKRHGRNRIEFFAKELGALLRERTNLELQLKGAIGRGEISVQYQPEFDIESNTLVRFEALARWQHPTLGQVPPAMFIPVAEESGLIVALGAFVMEKSCLEAAKWQNTLSQPVQIAVNVSSVQFRREGFVEEVAGVLRSTGLRPDLLQLELTESVMIGGAQRSAETMRELKALGISLAIDDFGTGYSSLSYLHALPFDALKIDRTFIREVDSKPESEAMVTSIVALARNIGLRVIVEGVETRRELEIIEKIGGHEIQGFLFGRPTSDPAALIGQQPGHLRNTDSDPQLSREEILTL